MKAKFYISLILILALNLFSKAELKFENFYNPIFINDGYPEIGKISSPAPNPVYDYAEILYNLPQNSNGEIAIYDFTGLKIKSFPIEGGEGKVKISAFDLKNGVYFACLISEGKNLDSKKFIKN